MEELVTSITDKRSEVSVVTHQGEGEIRLSHPSVAQLGVNRADIKSMEKVGNDLIVTLTSEKTLVFHDFFLKADGIGNDIVLQEEDGSLWTVSFYDSLEGFSYEYTPIDSIDPFMAGGDRDGGDIAVPLLIYGASALGVGKLLQLGDEHAPAPPPLRSAPTIGSVVDDVEPVVGPLKSGDFTNDPTPTINGVGGRPGDTISVYDNDKLLGTTTVKADGTWSFTPTDSPLDEGPHKLEAVASGPTGDPSGKSSPFELTVDTTAPTGTVAITAYEDDVAPKTGDFGSGTVTNDNTPKLKGTVTGVGDGEVVRIYDENGQPVGDAKVVNGSWEYQLGHLNDGAHSYTARVVDEAGNQGPQSNTFSLTVDTLAPPPPDGDQDLIDDQLPVTGTIPRDGVTDDTRPTYTGHADPKQVETINVYNDGKLFGSTTVDKATGNWIFEPKTPLGAGSYSFTAKSVDAAGNESTATQPWPFTVITDRPAPPSIVQVLDDYGTVTGPLMQGDVTDDRTLTIKGTGTAGTKVTIFVDDVAAGSTTVDANGDWSVEMNPPMSTDGPKKITAQAVDGAGQLSPKTGEYLVVLDTTAPNKQAVPGAFDDVGPHTGPIHSGDTTDDKQPTFSGKGEVGSTITISDGEKELGTTKVDKDGNWTFTPTKPLDDGDHSITTTETDKAGNKGPSSEPLTFKVDTTDVVVSIDKAVDDVGPITGDIPNGGTTDDTKPTLVGTTTAGAVVIVKDGVMVLGSTVADVDGNWSFTPTVAQKEGLHTYTATAQNEAKVEGTASFQLTIDTTAPDTPAIGKVLDDVGEYQGELKNGDSTDDTTPTLTGTGATSGDTINVYDNGKLLGTTTVKPDGSWLYTPTTTTLPEGSHDLQVSASDPAGNESPKSPAFTIVVDTTPPEAKATISSITDDTGIPGDFKTSDTTLLVTATVDKPVGAGEKVQISLDNGAHWNDATATATAGQYQYDATGTTLAANTTHTFKARVIDAAGNTGTVTSQAVEIDTIPPHTKPTIDSYFDDIGAATGNFLTGTTTDDQQPKLQGTVVGEDGKPATLDPGDVVRIYEGTTLLGTATVTGTTWSYQFTTNLSDGEHKFTAVVADKVGLEGTKSSEFTLKVDTANVEATAKISAIVDDTGESATDFITRDNTLLVNAKIETGTLKPGDKVQISVNNGTDWHDAPLTGGNYQYDATGTTLPDGTYTFKARVVNAAGKLGTELSQTVVIDTKDPTGTVAITAYEDNVAPNTGDYYSGSKTNDTSPLLKGTVTGLETGEIVKVYGDGDVFLGNATIAGSSWSYQLDGLKDGTTYKYTAKIVDAAGNGGTKSDVFTLTVDTTPPPPPDGNQDLIDDVGDKQGTIERGSVTDDANPEYTGHYSYPTQATTINVYDNGKFLGSTEIDKTTGNWSFTPKLALSDGKHIFTAKAADEAGNESTATVPWDFTVDTGTGKPPVPAITQVLDDHLPVTAALMQGDPTDDTTLTIAGTCASTTPVTVTVFVKDVKTGTEVVAGSAAVDASGKWSVTIDPPLSGDGDKIITAEAETAAGNKSGRTGDWQFTLDTTPPGKPSVVTAMDDVGDVKGPIHSSDTTDDNQPTFGGKGEVGSTVTIYDGTAKLGTATVDKDGNWSFTPTKSLGEGTHSITTTEMDRAGNISEMSDPLAFTVDTSTVAVRITKAIDDQLPITGDLAKGDATDDVRPTLVGTTDKPGVVVTISEGATVLGSTTSDVSKNWSFTPTADQSEGQHTYTATVKAPGGDAVTDSFTLTIDKTAPNTPSIGKVTDDVGLYQGPLHSGDSTDDTTPTLEGTGATPGDTINVYDNNNLLGTTTVKADGSWLYTPTTTTLIEGKHDLQVSASDPVGNESPRSAVFTLIVDTTPPPGIATISSITDDTGNSATDFITSDQTLLVNATLTGTLGTGEKVQISLDNGAHWHDAVSKGGNNYQYDATGTTLDEDTYTFKARVIDAASNTGTETSQQVIIDKTPPTQTVTINEIWDDVAPGIGTISNGGSTNDSQPELRGTVSAKLAADEVIAIYRDGATTSIGNATVGTDGLTWSFTDTSGGMVEGHTYTYTARVVDLAGNLGSASDPYSMKLLSIPEATPEITDVQDNVEPGIGTVPKDGYTNDTTPEIIGKVSMALSPGERVEIYRDGAATPVGTATIGSSGLTWSFTDSGLEDGKAYTYTAKVVNDAGTGGVSNAWTIHVDTTPPSAKVTIDNYYDDVGDAQGIFLGGTITDDKQPKLQGTVKDLQPGESVYIYEGTTKYGPATVTGENWSFQFITDLDKGLHKFTAVAVDEAGNKGEFSPEFTIDVWWNDGGTKATVTIDTFHDNVDPIQGDFGSGTTTNDKQPLLQGKVVDLQSGDTVHIYKGTTELGTATVTGGDWTYQIATDLPDGDYTFKAVIVDAAKNIGNNSGDFQITVDTLAPPPPKIDEVHDDANDLLGNLDKSVPHNGFTNDRYVTINGSEAEAGGTVFVYSNNNGSNTLLGSVTADPTGHWTFSPPLGSPLPLGINAITATTADKAGNVSGPSQPHSFMVDVVAPTHGVTIEVYDDVAPVQGVVPNSYYTDTPYLSSTNDTSPEIRGTITAPLRAEYGDKVYVYRDGEILGTATVTGTGWTFQDTGLVNGQTYNYWARVISGAGIGGAQSIKYQITIDTTPPPQKVQIETVWDDQSAVPGNVSNGGKTADLTPELRGSMLAAPELGDSVVIYRNNVKIATIPMEGITGVWTWKYIDSGLQDGQTYVYTAKVLDAAGNEGTLSSSYTITIDSTAITPTSAPIVPLSASLSASLPPLDQVISGVDADQHNTATGGAGNDHIGIVSTNFANVNGGAGWDTLVFEGSNLTLDLTTMGTKVRGFEEFDLNNQSGGAIKGLLTGATTGNTLKLTLADVQSEHEGGITQGGQHMTIRGDNTSTVELEDAGWTTVGTQTVNGVTFDVWHNAAMGVNMVADLLIQQSVLVHTV